MTDTAVNHINYDLIPKDVPQEMVEDFRNHIWSCFKYLNLGEPTAMQYAMAESLQTFNQDMQLQALRGAGKSVITAMLASWFLLRDPNRNVMVISATSQKAIEFISMVRKILTYVPYMSHLEPGVNQKDNAFGFNISGCTILSRQDLACFARGITSQITGSHADYIIVDDVEIEGNCETPAQREKILGKLTELENIRNQGGRVIFLGTPQTGDSIYFRLKVNYPVIKYPGIYPDPSVDEEWADVASYVRELGLSPGEPTEPVRCGLSVLERKMASLGPSRFALHYKLTTGLSDMNRYPLKFRDLIVMDCDREVFPERVVWSGQYRNDDIVVNALAGDYVTRPQYVSPNYVRYSDRVLYVDPSGRGEDETAYCVTSFAHGYIVVHELAGLPGGYDDTVLQKICDVVANYGIRAIHVEDNMGDGMFQNLLIPHLIARGIRCDVEGFRVTKAKEQRICDTLEPVMSTHRLVVNTPVVRDQTNQTQISRMQRKKNALKHDDRIDILASAVRHFAEGVSVDTGRASKDRAQQDFDREMFLLENSGRGIGSLIDGRDRYVTVLHNGMKKDDPIKPKTVFEQPRVSGFLDLHNRLRRGRR